MKIIKISDCIVSTQGNSFCFIIKNEYITNGLIEKGKRYDLKVSEKKTGKDDKKHTPPIPPTS